MKTNISVWNVVSIREGSFDVRGSRSLHRFQWRFTSVFKKRPNFCYKDFILQHLKHCPLQNSPLNWRYTVPNVSSIVGMLPGTHFLWWRAVLLSNFPESLRVQKKTELLKQRANQHRGRATATEVLTTNCICPVLLWALVVELHPLNWARAQAVRRIN